MIASAAAVVATPAAAVSCPVHTSLGMEAVAGVARGRAIGDESHPEGVDADEDSKPSGGGKQQTTVESPAGKGQGVVADVRCRPSPVVT